MSDFTNPEILHKTLGEYWYSIYYGNEQIGNYVAALCFNREQWDNQFRDTKNALSRHKIANFETVKVKPFKLLQSKFLESSKIYPKYDGKYDHMGKIYYDVPIYSSFTAEIPKEIVKIGYIANKLLDPTVILDGTIVNNTLKFTENPFKQDFRTENIYDENGKIVDKAITLWFFDVEIDKEDVYYQYGYIFNIKLPSSEQYKELINILYDSLINGPSERVLKLYFSVITGIPVIREDTEKVLEVTEHYVRTDKNEYFLTCDDVATVKVGAILHVGDPISAGLAFYTPKTVDDRIISVSLDQHYIGICVNNIVFHNKELKIEPKIDKETNLTRVDLPIGGTETDKTLFNDYVFETGVENMRKVDEMTARKVLNG